MKYARIVVTGMGAYTPLGNSKEYFKRSINGESAIRDVTEILDVKYTIKPGEQIPILKTCGAHTGALFYKEQLDDSNFGKEVRRMSHATKISSLAAKEAIIDSGIDYETEDFKTNTGVAIGSGFGGISDIEKGAINAIAFDDEMWEKECLKNGRKRNIKQRGLERIDPFISLKSLPGAPASYVAGYYKLHKISTGLSDECGSGLSNVIYGCKNIQLDLLKMFISGGTGDALSILTFGGFDNIGALSRKGISRPFDKDRDGFIIGDGAGILFIEELEHAKKRGAKIYAEILGYGETLDGIYGTGTSDDAEYATLAIKDALTMAELNPEDISLINSHGTSTLLNDWQETRAFKQAFGEHIKNIPITADKSKTGHMLNATGAVELISSIMSIQENVIPPIINVTLDSLDTCIDYHDEKLRKYFEACNLDYVLNKPREVPIRNVLSTNFAFGGRNFAMAVGRYR